MRGTNAPLWCDHIASFLCSKFVIRLTFINSDSRSRTLTPTSSVIVELFVFLSSHKTIQTGPFVSSFFTVPITGILAIRIHAIYGLETQIKRCIGTIWIMTSMTSIALLVSQDLQLIRECKLTLLNTHSFPCSNSETKISTM